VSSNIDDISGEAPAGSTGSGFALRIKRTTRCLTAEGEVVPTETGSRIQLALFPCEQSSVFLGVGFGLTALLSIPSLVEWLQAGVVGFSVGLPIAAALLTSTVSGWQTRQITDTDREAVVRAVVKALRGAESV
jgi:hypothetical protein